MAKIQSNERIAQMESQTEKEVASLKAAIDLQKIELKNQFDQVAQQFQGIEQLIGATNSVNPVMHLDKMAGAISQLADTHSQNQAQFGAQMQAAMQQMAQKRRRVPIRDKNGDIIEVRELDDAPPPQAPMQIGPPSGQVPFPPR